jgi:central kinetochore subunit Mis15/CHL4
LRGSKRTNNVGGGWSIFVDDKPNNTTKDKKIDEPNQPTSQENEAEKENQQTGTKRHRNILHEPSSQDRKRLKHLASGRFGTSAQTISDKPLERFDVKIIDPFSDLDGILNSPSEDVSEGDDTLSPDLRDWKPEVRLSFHGASVFHGLRKLVEAGVMDGVKLPGWLTGQEGVSWGVIREGRMVPREES